MAERTILVVGGGDSAVEAALGLAGRRGNRVTLSYRREKLVRIKKKNEGRIAGMLASRRIEGAFNTDVQEIGATSVRLIALIAAPEGIERIHRDYPDVAIVVASIDRCLNEVGYIVPGLGDAGDRLYGT